MKSIPGLLVAQECRWEAMYGTTAQVTAAQAQVRWFFLELQFWQPCKCMGIMLCFEEEWTLAGPHKQEDGALMPTVLCN